MKLMQVKMSRLLVGLGIGFGATGVASGAEVLLVNPGFDYTTNGDGSGGQNSVTGQLNPIDTWMENIVEAGLPNYALFDSAVGWAENGTVSYLGWDSEGTGAGAQSLDGATYFPNGSSPTGAGAFANSGAYLVQTIAGGLSSNMSYTLSVEVYDRYGTLATDSSPILLSLRDGAGNELSGGMLTIPDVANGMTVATFEVDVASVDGSDLQLFLGSDGGQINFDNISLDAVVVPTLSLLVNKANGAAMIANNAGTEVTFDLYEILSESGSVNVDGWEAIGGEWDGLGTVDTGFIGEGNLTGNIELSDGERIGIGSVHDLGGDEDLSFSYRSAAGVLFDIEVEYLADVLDGDVNMDGMVDGLDLDLVKTHFGEDTVLGDANGDGVTNLADLFVVRNNIGNGVVAVPEPGSVLIMGMVLSAVFVRRDK